MHASTRMQPADRPTPSERGSRRRRAGESLPRRVAACCCAMLLGVVPSLRANTAPVSVDDVYQTVSGHNLSVDEPGVLDNDHDADGDDLQALLVDSSQASGLLLLFADGSLEYEPAPGFVGDDVFTYVANDGTTDGNPASVTFHVMPGSASNVFTNQATYLAAVSALGLVPELEGFEDDGAWGAARSPATATSVTSQGITWTANNPTSQITTGHGAALFGSWGFYQIPHGNQATGSGCSTPGACTDGWRGSSPQTLVAIGGWVRVNAGIGAMSLILDGDTANPIDFGGISISSATGPKFLGYVDPDGFHSFEWRETEGVAEDQVYCFADDFTFAYDASWSETGRGTLGSNGTPHLQGSGPLVGGATVAWTITSGLPNGSAWLVLGFSLLDAPFKGGVLVPSPDVLVGGLPLDAAGSLPIGFTWPAGLVGGVMLALQAWIADPGNPSGFASSNALVATTP
ncbi:MAG: Ig-like domain-containing protein [Planctomycetes bacterium]|nr:Ig-like domain-containing protein [Planctomycetota bacterium]